MWLVGRVVPVLSDTDASPFPFYMWQKKRRKAWCLYNGFTTWDVISPAVSETLPTYPSSRQWNFPSRISHIYWLLRFAYRKYWQATIVTILPLHRLSRFLHKKWLAAARANWKTNVRELWGIPGRYFRCWWLAPLFAKQIKSIFALSHITSTAVLLLNSRIWFLFEIAYWLFYVVKL